MKFYQISLIPNRLLTVVFLSVIFVSLTVNIAYSGSGYDRVVLMEDFTNSGCGPCAYWEPYFNAGTDDFEDSEWVLATFHVWWPANTDPWWVANNAENEDRTNFYGVRGVPSYWVDGTNVGLVNPPDTFSENVKDAIQRRLDTESPLEIIVGAYLSGDDLITEVTVNAQDDLDNLTLYVGLFDKYGEYSPGPGPDVYINSMIDMLPDADGTDFDIENEGSEEFDFETSPYVGPFENEVEDLIVIAWVQDRNEVYQAASFDLDVQSPMLSVVEWEIDDTDGGNGDGRAEAGEDVSLVLTIENSRYYLEAENIVVTLSSEDEEIDITEDTFELEFLENGQGVTNEDTPFAFTVSDDFVAHPVEFTVSIMADPGDFQIFEDYSFMVEWPSVLVMDASDDRAAKAAVMTNFGVEDIPFADRADHSDDILTSELLSHYEVVLWHSFNNAETPINDWDIEILSEYLDDGGTLILTGAHMASVLDNTDFMEDFLGASLETAQANFTRIRGTTSDPHFDGSLVYLAGGEAIDFADATPILNVEDNGRAVMNYDRSGQDLGVAAIANENETFRTLLLSFPIESIGGLAGSEVLSEFTARLWNWVQNPHSAPGDGEILPEVFSMSPAYPNPFNSQSVVPFSLSTTGRVTMSIFDTNGRLISSLIDGELSAGRHEASINASSAGLTNGLYYIRLNSSSGTLSQKLLYLR